ncbi:MAG TPA: tetratricopeptide repeat protein [Alphaproteobacteria bacterium]|nr:tetratricopeptide repeat protein [Alphaproteobacteria bacterium]
MAVRNQKSKQALGLAVRTFGAAIAMIVWSMGASADDIAAAKRAFDNERYQQAVALLRPLAEAGDARAQYYLGYVYDQGRWVHASRSKAFEWFEKSAAKDHTPGLRGLGRLLILWEVDVKRGQKLLTIAAERGDSKAQWMLGLFIADRRHGVTGTKYEARAWLIKAIEQKNVMAPTRLMFSFLSDRNYVDAHKWEIIGQHIRKTSKPLLIGDIRKEMTSQQIAEARRRADTWLKAHGMTK